MNVLVMKAPFIYKVKYKFKIIEVNFYVAGFVILRPDLFIYLTWVLMDNYCPCFKGEGEGKTRCITSCLQTSQP